MVRIFVMIVNFKIVISYDSKVLMNIFCEFNLIIFKK